MWLLFAILSAATASLVAIFGKLGLKGLDSTVATTIRVVVMTVFLFIFTISLGKWKLLTSPQMSGRDWMLIALSGVAGALSWLFYFAAIKYGPVTKVVVIDRMSLILTIILAAIFLGEALTWKVVGGAGLMIAGALMIVLK